MRNGGNAVLDPGGPRGSWKVTMLGGDCTRPSNATPCPQTARKKITMSLFRGMVVEVYPTSVRTA